MTTNAEVHDGSTREHDAPSLGGLAPPTLDALAETKQALAIGRDLGPRYEVQGFLGRGAFATVWKAFDRITQEPIAIKHFDARLRDLAGFYHELRALFSLKHDRIVRIVNLMESSAGARYLFLEYCAGGSLRGMLNRAQREGRRCPPGRARVLAVQIAEALAAAHRMGLVHRDLKPENVLLESPEAELFVGDARVKLVDFGLARALQRGVASAAAVPLAPLSGTPAYMAPEQFESAYGPASDVYALGVVLYELLHGRLPFIGGPSELAAQHLQVKPAIDPSLPTPWPDLLARLLAKEPKCRPDCTELVETLGIRDLDHRCHPARSRERFARVRVLADRLLSRRGPGGAWEILVVGPEGIARHRADDGASLGFLDLPGLALAATGPDGSIWTVRGSVVSRLSPDSRREDVLTLDGVASALHVDALDDRLTRLALIVGDQLCEYLPGKRRDPLWRRPLRTRGAWPNVVRLRDGRIVSCEGPHAPRLVFFSRDGDELAAIPLPGPCWQLWHAPRSRSLFLTALVANRHVPHCLDTETLQLFPLCAPDGEVMATCVAPIGSRVSFLALYSTGELLGWNRDGACVCLGALGGDSARGGAIAVAGRHVAVLCRTAQQHWLHLDDLPDREAIPEQL